MWNYQLSIIIFYKTQTSLDKTQWSTAVKISNVDDVVIYTNMGGGEDYVNNSLFYL